MTSRMLIGAFGVAVVAALAACAAQPEGSGAAAGESRPGVAGGLASTVVPGTEEDLRKNVGDRVFFDKDSAVISPEGLTALQRQAQWLLRYPQVSVTIEGHCDERGTREYNLALGYRRAHDVKEVLIAAGIEARRMTTLSYGKERPEAVGSNEAAWAQNRRAVTRVDSSAVAHQ